MTERDFQTYGDGLDDSRLRALFALADGPDEDGEAFVAGVMAKVHAQATRNSSWREAFVPAGLALVGLGLVTFGPGLLDILGRTVRSSVSNGLPGVSGYDFGMLASFGGIGLVAITLAGALGVVAATERL
jgi:hypothetical protein